MHCGGAGLLGGKAVGSYAARPGPESTCFHDVELFKDGWITLEVIGTTISKKKHGECMMIQHLLKRDG